MTSAGAIQVAHYLIAAVFLISQILIIVTAAGIYSWLLTTSGIPRGIVAAGADPAQHLPAWQVLPLVNVGLLLVGSFLEPPAAIMILTPLLLPVVQAAGVNAIHFGIIMAVNLSIGMAIAAPLAQNSFASQAIFNQPLGSIYRGVVPFVLINFATLMLDQLRAGDFAGAGRGGSVGDVEARPTRRRRRDAVRLPRNRSNAANAASDT